MCEKFLDDRCIIPEDIKRMSAAEIKKEIERLEKKTKIKPPNHKILIKTLKTAVKCGLSFFALKMMNYENLRKTGLSVPLFVRFSS